MEYMTAAEAAEKWGVKIRQVQRLAAAGRIPGARKHMRDYLIPADAEKPADPRKGRIERGEPYHINRDKSLSRELVETYAALAPITVPIDKPYSMIEAVQGKSLRTVLEMWLAYSKGDFELVKRRFNEIEENNTKKLVASGIAIAAAISLGDYPFFLEVESYLKSVVKADAGADVTAQAELMLAVAYNGASAYSMLPKWLINGDFGLLHHSAKPTAAYMRVQYLSRQNPPELALAVAQAYFSVYSSDQAITYEDTYLRIDLAAACHALGRTDEAENYLRSAMKKNLPHGFITAFAERMAVLSGLCEQLLEREFPEHYDAVTSQFERVTKNWVVFHNRFTQDNITLILSLKEIQMARLAAQGLSDPKIAEHFGLAYKTVKNRMDTIYDSLCISGKKRKRELAKFIY
jgi:DNA-binding NarL/FixJ family response regulator